MKRRDFMLATALTGAIPGLLHAASERKHRSTTGFGPLVPDQRRILDLPAGFHYRVITVQGQGMNDGYSVPGWPDGMHAFKIDNGRVAILCNHELATSQLVLSAWRGQAVASQSVLKNAYDVDNKGRIAPGGVRRIIYNLHKQQVEEQHLALCGTLRNCSGGMTPWSSWISCEESVVRKGQQGLSHSHGYCFEVPAEGDGLQAAVPLTAMGRFNHEAVAIDPDSGAVYLTEDRADGLFYRFLPAVRGQLSAGGKLQALAITSLPQLTSTGNRGAAEFPLQTPQVVKWLTMNGVDAPADDLRHRGRRQGAVQFVRGEGMVVEQDKHGRTARIWIMCTTGGKQGLGQVFYYEPSVYEGKPGEEEKPGRLTLFSEPNNPELLRNGDNLALMPNGDLLVCEDHQRLQRLVGITASGEYYVLARNPRGASEFTGATFSPDGSTLFVNLQQQGGTLAISGPWHKRLNT